MKYEIQDKDITFNVKTDHIGKWGIINAIEQVDEFWHQVDHHKTFKRKDFETVIIKIERVDVL